MHADATRRSHVREPVATDPPDGLRMPTYEASFGQARMDLNDQLVRRFQVVRVGSSAKRAAAAILGGHPPQNEQLISVPVCIGFPRL